MIASPKSARAGRPARAAASRLQAHLSQPAEPAPDVFPLFPLHEILPNPFQPRMEFDPVKLQQLAESLKTHGFIQPLAVRQVGTSLQLIDGERRRRAAKLAGLTEAPVMLRTATDDEAAQLAIVANDQREELTPIERARAYADLLERGVFKSQRDLGNTLQRSQGFVSNTMRLLELPEEWKRRVASGEVGESHGLHIVMLARSPAALEQLESDLSARTAAVESRGGKATFPPLTEFIEMVETVRERVAAADGTPTSADVGEAPLAGETTAPAPVGLRHRGGDRHPADGRGHDDEDKGGATLEQLRASWFDELLTREIESRGAEGILRGLGIDLADVWRKELMDPFTWQFFELHSKPELLSLADELNVVVNASRPKPIIIRQLIGKPATKKTLPAKLAWGN